MASPRGRSNIVAAFNKLSGDKSIDVSNMDSTGKGYRTVTRPNAPTKRFWASSEPRIISSNAQPYENALRLLGYNKTNDDKQRT